MKSVPQSDIPQSPFLWTRATAARETLRHLDRNGIDAEPLLAKAELSRGQLSGDRGGVSVVSECRFLELGAIATNDPLLGLHVAAETDLRSFGILFYLGASSATVAEALKHLARYSGTGNEANRFEISRHKDETVLTNRPALAFRRASSTGFRIWRAGGYQSARQGDEPRFCPVAHHLCAHEELGFEGDPSRPAMSGRVRVRCRQLGVTRKRHGAANSFQGQPSAADPGDACGRSALATTHCGRTAGFSGKPARQRASQRQSTGGDDRPTARHERAVIQAAPR